MVGILLIAIVAWRVLRPHDDANVGQLPLLVIGALLIAAGALGRRFPGVYGGLGTVALNVLVAVAVLELIASIVLAARPPSASQREAVYRTSPSLPYYTSKAWGGPYWREFAAANTQFYAPYVLARRRPFKGQYVNIDDRRLRRTPGAQCESGAFILWMFGGSTMWGTGAPDSLTIPALMERALSSRMHAPVCVVNFGESAWVSEQSVVQLTLALRDGGRPNAVVFYDGVNDVYAAYQANRAGAHQNESATASSFRPPPWPRQMLQGLATYSLIKDIAARGAPAPKRADPAMLADSVVAKYLGAVNVVRALGKADGFRTFFFWQPEIAEAAKPLTPRERAYAGQLGKGVVALYHETYDRMTRVAADSSDDLYDLAHAFEGVPDELFLDWAHVVPEGNARVVDAMLRAWDTAYPVR